MSKLDITSPLYNIAHNVSHVSSQEFLLHAHSFYEIYYFMQGEVDFRLGSAEYELKPGTLILIPPNVLHGIRVHSILPYDRYTLHFDAELLSAERREALLSVFPEPSSPSAGLWRKLNSDHVEDQIHMFNACQELDEQTQKIMIPILLEAILAQIYALSSKSGTSRPKERTMPIKHEMIDYIDQHFTEPVTLDSLAKSLFLSKSQLNHICRKVTGTTVMDYIIRKRVVYAQHMLGIGLAAAQACELAGFGDYTSFYRAYVKYFGHPPKEDKRDPTAADPLKQFVRDAKNSAPDAGAQKKEALIWDRNQITIVGQDPATVHD